ncbi:MAG TPA: DNA-binding protein WhiA [Candidatus Rubrimentiphilum sp.]|nr:DNA-binding protein WhiA [Candidatus Rubrimentiphilum sp.]
MISSLSADTKDALARDLPAEAHCREALRNGLSLYGARKHLRAATARLLRRLQPAGKRPDFRAHERKPHRRCDRIMEARAAFLGCGSLSAGAQGYHLEFVVQPKEAALRLEWTLRALGAIPKHRMRAGRHLLYYKDFEAIVQILGTIGAHAAVLQLENLHAVKETKNRIHRLVNTETANLERVTSAAAQQRETIEFVGSAHGLHHLSKPLREIAELRLGHPDESLAELGRRCSPPVAKATVNSRLGALTRLARRLRGETAATKPKG